MCAFWDEQDSEEPKGWYLAKVISTNPDGTVCLLYKKDKLTETAKVTDLRWHPARCPDKWFHPPNGFLANLTVAVAVADLRGVRHPPFGG